MEKLIIEINYTDGYTYDFNNHLPVIFSSKEEFIIILEETIEKIIKETSLIKIKLEKKQEELTKVYISLRDKKNKEKPDEKITLLIKKLLEENGSLVSEHEEKKKFMLGGQNFHVESFVSEENGKKTIVLPNVQTLDEYFKEVTNNYKE